MLNAKVKAMPQVKVKLVLNHFKLEEGYLEGILGTYQIPSQA